MSHLGGGGEETHRDAGSRGWCGRLSHRADQGTEGGRADLVGVGWSQFAGVRPELSTSIRWPRQVAELGQG